MSDVFKKYPLAEKAAEAKMADMEGLFFFIGGEAACLAAPVRIAEIVDQTIDDAPVMKEAVIISTYFSMDMDMMTTGIPDDFETDYSPEAKLILDEMFLGLHGGKAEPSSLVMKSQAVLAITSMELFAATLQQAEAEGVEATDVPRAMLGEMKDQVAADEKRLFPALGDAPKLKALYIKAKEDVFALVDKEAGNSPKAQPKGPEPK